MTASEIDYFISSEVLLEGIEAVGEFKRFCRQAISRTPGRN